MTTRDLPTVERPRQARNVRALSRPVVDPASAAGELATRLSGLHALGPTLDALLDTLAALLVFDECVVALPDRSRTRLTDVHRAGPEPGRKMRHGAGADLMSDADRQGVALRATAQGNDSDARLDAAHRIALPLGPGGEPTGAIGLAREDGAFTDDELLLLNALSSVAAPRIGNCLAEERLNRAVLNLENAQAELERTQTDYRSLFECHPSLLFMLDEDRQIMMANDTACALLGLAEEQVLGERFETLVNDPERAACLRQIEAGWHDASPAGHESALLVSGYPDLRVRMTLRRIKLSHGRPGMLIVADDITESWQLQQRLRYEADHDALTGLTNRNCFERRLQKRLADLPGTTESLALLSLDLDHFKEVNDTAGHAAGDELLRRLAEIFSASVRGADSVARIGGDEFAMLLNNCDARDAHRIAEGVRSRVENLKFRWGENEFRIAVSIGLVMLQESDTLETALSAADSALYAAKREGRNQVRGFSPEDFDQFAQSLDIEQARQVQNWIQEGRLELFQQPVVASTNVSGVAVAHELLIRCRFEDELLHPEHLLPQDDRLGVAALVDRWVISRASQLSRERAGNGLEASAPLVINLWPRTVADPALAGDIIDTINQSGAQPESFIFELPGVCLVEQAAAVERLCTELVTFGCRFGLDGVGADLNVFEQLRDLQFHYIKLNDSLTNRMPDDDLVCAKVRAIVAVAQTQSVLVGAKKVESTELLELLADVGIDFVQGHVTGHPRAIVRVV